MSKQTLWLPPSSRVHKEPGKYTCEICLRRLPPQDEDAARFQTYAQLVRHLDGSTGKPGCADRHPETVRGMSPALKAPGIFDENYDKGGADPEWGQWLRSEDVRAGRKNWKTSDGKS